MKTCDICGKPATCGVRDVFAISEAVYYRYEYDGEAVYLCDTHAREPKITEVPR